MLEKINILYKLCKVNFINISLYKNYKEEYSYLDNNYLYTILFNITYTTNS